MKRRPAAATPQRKGRTSESPKTEATLTPIQGNFIPVSPESPNRARSLSPRKRLPHQKVHIRVNLTETQMDKLAGVITTSPQRQDATDLTGPPGQDNNTIDARHTSPDRNRGRQHPGSPQKYFFKPEFIRPNDPDASDLDLGAPGRRHSRHDSDSTTFAELMPRGRPGEVSPRPSQHRNETLPAPIEIDDAQRYVTLPRGPPPPRPTRPDTPDLNLYDSDPSSVYSQDENTRMKVHPLHVPNKKNGKPTNSADAALQSHGARETSSLGTSPPNCGRRSVRRSKSLHGIKHSKSRPNLSANPSPERTYSPLTPFFADKSFPVPRKGKKTLIGDNGWLERTVASPEKKGKESPKKQGLFDSLKKIAKEMTEMKSNRRSRESDKETKSSSAVRIAISLDPREQSLLYGELEYNLSNALQYYITTQLEQGRLFPDKLKKVADAWAQKGRPRVVGFRYDVETQLDLVALHEADFRFYGRRQGNPIEVTGLLDAMRTNARAMRIRTFCQPDSVIAKQLVDSQSLFNMLGCPEAQQIALAEVCQFFKVIVEREQAYQRRCENDGKKTLPHGQGDRKWEPPNQLPEGADPYGGLNLVPDGYNVDTEKLVYLN